MVMIYHIPEVYRTFPAQATVELSFPLFQE